MKYWLLTTEQTLNPENDIGHYCSQWSQILQQNGAEVTVFLPSKSVTRITKRSVKGIRYIEFPPDLVDTSAYLGYDTMISYSFAEAVKVTAQKEGIPDWIESQDYKGIAYFILQKKHLQFDIYKDLKIVINCYAPLFLTFGPNHLNAFQFPWFWIGEMEKFCMQAADVLTSASPYLVKTIQSALAIDAAFHFVNNPYLMPVASHKAVETDQKVIFWAHKATLEEIMQVVSCFKQLWQDGYTYALQIIGEAEHFLKATNSTLEQLIQKKYSSFINRQLLQFTGTNEKNQVRKAIKTAKTVILPASVNSFSYMLMECMAAGKIILTTRQGGHGEMVKNNFNGFLYDRNDDASFIKQVHAIFSLTREEELQIIKEAGKTIQTVCNPDSCYQKKIKLLQSFKVTRNTHFPFVRPINITETGKQPEGIRNLLSVIIPYHNLGIYIQETLDAILSSDYPDIEVIIIDDGSDDKKSIQALELIQNKKVTIIRQPNQGLSIARNRGAMEAKGEFIAYLDADDKIDKTYYSKAIRALQSKKNIHFVGCWVQYFEESNNIWAALNPEPPLLLYHNMINSGGMIYRRDAFLKAGQNDARFIYGMEDYDSVINMVKNGYHGVVIPETLFYYRIRRGSMARGFNRSNQLYLYQLLSEKHKEFYATFTTEITNLLNANGPGYKFDNPTMDYHLYKDDSTYEKLMRKISEKIKQPQLKKATSMIYKKYINKA